MCNMLCSERLPVLQTSLLLPPGAGRDPAEGDVSVVMSSRLLRRALATHQHLYQVQGRLCLLLQRKLLHSLSSGPFSAPRQVRKQLSKRADGKHGAERMHRVSYRL